MRGHVLQPLVDPFAGLRQRRRKRGLPTGPMKPLEWWQVIEKQNVRELDRRGL